MFDRVLKCMGLSLVKSTHQTCYILFQYLPTNHKVKTYHTWLLVVPRHQPCFDASGMKIVIAPQTHDNLGARQPTRRLERALLRFLCAGIGRF